MEQGQYLIDTNAVIDYLGNKIPNNGMVFMNKIVNATPNISIITKIELLGFNTTSEHSLLLADFVQDASVIDLTEEIADISIAIRRSHKIKLPDAIIAATAISKNYVLITRNFNDFKNIQGLTVLDAHSQ